MSTEESSDHPGAAVQQRNHSHTPTPSTADVNVEASLISSSQLFTTSASLLDCVDSIPQYSGALTGVEKMLVVLRDGKKIIGVLRSFDQYGASLA